MKKLLFFSFLNLLAINATAQERNCDELQTAMQSREKVLKAEGWVKVVDKCDTKTIVINDEFEPGYAYTAITAIKTDGKPETRGVLFIKDEKDNFAGNSKKTGTEKILLLETNDYQPIEGQAKMVFASGAVEGELNQTKMTIFKKTKDFKRDFYRILESRNKKFDDLKSFPLVKNGKGFMEYNSIISLGVQNAKISEDEKLVIFMIEAEYLDKEIATFITNVVQVIQELPAKGYSFTEFKDISGNDVTQFSINGEPAVTLKTGEKVYFEITKRK